MSDRNPPTTPPPDLPCGGGFFRAFQAPDRRPAHLPARPIPVRRQGDAPLKEKAPADSTEPGGALDRRGEALLIFTTVFVRPALELRLPIQHLATTCAFFAIILASELSETSVRTRSGRARQY